MEKTATENIRFWFIGTAVLALSWSWIVAMAVDMYGPMDGASAWMMRTEWDAVHLFLLWAMWAVMMAAMMLPAAFPLLLLVQRRHAADGRLGGKTAMLAAGYLSVWSLFSVAAAALQWLLGTLQWLNMMMEAANYEVAGLICLVAGIYQFTPLKHACLNTCRSPLSFIMQHWHPGLVGAYRVGVEHGLYCLGCCWALMALLYAGGIMNLWVIVALTVWVLIEKTTPFGEFAARVCGLMLIGAGIWLLMN